MKEVKGQSVGDRRPEDSSTGEGKRSSTLLSGVNRKEHQGRQGKAHAREIGGFEHLRKYPGCHQPALLTVNPAFLPFTFPCVLGGKKLNFDFPGTIGALAARNSSLAAFAESGHNLGMPGLGNPAAEIPKKKPETRHR